MLNGLVLPPAIAVVIFVVACWSGYQFRRVWKAEGPVWLLWIWGLLAATGLLTVGFVPLNVSS